MWAARLLTALCNIGTRRLVHLTVLSLSVACTLVTELTSRALL